MTFKNKLAESGVIKKRWHGRRSVAVVFPDSYGLGMANLGFQRIYELLNQNEDIVAERFFCNKTPTDTRSLESNRHLSEFDIILLSVSFEMSYLNIAPFLLHAGIPLFSKDRTDEHPLVMAGGVACQINPCPAEAFVDAFILGDFEAIHAKFEEFVLGNELLSSSRENSLAKLVEAVDGIYCPILNKNSMVRPVIHTTSVSSVPHTVIVSNRSSFPNTFLLEITRGCGRGCRFCAAGFVYRPSRNWPEESIEQTISDTKGAKKIGLVGLEYASASFISEFSSRLLDEGYQLGFSSLRADSLTDEFVTLLVRSKNFTATIAPEAGSERLRRVINKNLTEEQILSAAETFARAGLKNLKLYFMMGLPYEDYEDIEEIARLAIKVREVMLGYAKGRGKMGSVIVSVSTFVPKAWTPFQWAAFEDVEVLKRKRNILKNRLARVPNIKLRLDSVESALLQAVLSRGDKSLGVLLSTLVSKGYGNKRMVKEISQIAENYLKEKGSKEEFPWEVVNHRVKRDYLLAQWRKAQRAEQTSFCNQKICRRCGAC